MKKFLIFIISIWFIFLFSALFFYLENPVLENESNLAASYRHLVNLLKKSRTSEITIFAVGDIMLDRGVEYMIEKKGNGDFRFPFFKIADDLNKADILFGNLEGPISDKGKKIGSIYSFRMDPKAVEGLQYAGFDVLSLANNHMFDYGRIALEDTMKNLKDNGIEYVGAGYNKKEAFSPKIINIDGTKIGILAYANLGPKNWQAKENDSGLAWLDLSDLVKIKKEIANVKDKVDVLIISLHSGEEYSHQPTYFQKVFARTCIEAGADIVIGHHPHVIQKVEKYKDGWIAYSLGNFVFDQTFSQDTMKGLLLEIKVRNGKIKRVEKKEVRILENFQVSI